MPTAEYYSTHVPGDAAQANYFRLTPTSVVARPLDAAVTRYEYSAFGDLTRQRVHANTIVESQDTSSTCDAIGRQTRNVAAAGHVTVMAYDVHGKLVRHQEL